MTHPFAITSRWTEHGPVLRVAGELDVATAGELREAIRRLLDTGTRRLVVDLHELDFIDSTALGVLVAAVKRLEGRDGALTVRRPTRAALRVFEMTGLLPLVRIEAGDEAVSA